jgi:hypothetical protein
VKAGDTISLKFTGLPHRATWPRNVALLVSTVILAAGAWGAMRGTAGTPQSARRGQLNTRRDKLFTELADLETERRKGAVDPARYAARRADLVTSLEDLYVELE